MTAVKIINRKMEDYTRVTDVLFPFSGLRNIDPHILQNAADRGTKVHEICDALINDLGVFEINGQIQGYIDSFYKWLPEKNFIERPDRFYCDELMLTGECDAIYKDQDGLHLVDFKTSANEGKTWKLQGSAYYYLAKQAGYDIKTIEFVKLSKDGKKPKVYIYDCEWETYLKCLEIYRLFFKPGSEENPLDYL